MVLCFFAVTLLVMPAAALEASRLGRIVLSYKTGRAGSGGYFHVRDDLPLAEQITGYARWSNMSAAEEGMLEAEVSRAVLGALAKVTPIHGAEVPAAERFSAAGIRKLVDSKSFQRWCEPVRLHTVDAPIFKQMQVEVKQIMAKNQAADVKSQNHPINWVLAYGKTGSYSLFSESGDLNNNSDLLTFDTQRKSFKYGDEYPAIARFMKLFPDTTNWRINVLHPNESNDRHQSSGFSPHKAYVLHEVRDMKDGKMKTALRMKFHMPIVTNSDVEMYQYDRSYGFHEKEVYFFTNGCTHSVENRGETPRIHMMWDMLLTADTWERMFGEGADLDEHVRRFRGEERQCEVKGKWHWTDFEMEPEKTWTAMQTFFDNLVDVSPPFECRLPSPRRAHGENDTSTVPSPAGCRHEKGLVSRWDPEIVVV